MKRSNRAVDCFTDTTGGGFLLRVCDAMGEGRGAPFRHDPHAVIEGNKVLAVGKLLLLLFFLFFVFFFFLSFFLFFGFVFKPARAALAPASYADANKKSEFRNVRQGKNLR
jgi:hypothetical protein